jgi:methanogenic corrinoid protein MtbC1
VLVPLMQEVGAHWYAGTLTVGQEHLISQAVRARLTVLLHVTQHRGERRALLGGFPEEQHEIGLLGVALRLRHAGWNVTMLGPRVPVEDVARMATALDVERVALSVVTELGVSAFADTLSALIKGVPSKTVVWLGGAAAQAHRALCERLGAHVFMGPEDWSRLVE